MTIISRILNQSLFIIGRVLYQKCLASESAVYNFGMRPFSLGGECQGSLCRSYKVISSVNLGRLGVASVVAVSAITST